MIIVKAIAILTITRLVISLQCPQWSKYGEAPPSTCHEPTDPLDKPKSKIENWLTEEVFNNLFPKANLGWGPFKCSPYNYKAFIIAARYFPNFGTQYVKVNPEGKRLKTNYTPYETYRRDLSAFFAHAIQETGENDVNLYKKLPKRQADDCFYRGGFFNWFEGGPKSLLIKNRGVKPSDGELCTFSGEYCDQASNNKWFYPCNNETSGKYYKGCYYGRGAIQISYNYNYGLFNRYLQQLGIQHNGKLIDLLLEPNLVITKTDPPLSIMASLWFYMTPQSPKPSMHDIIIGNWVSPDPDYSGGVFGPTSLVINNECNGEDPTDPGGPGESRRIKAFRWFTSYFHVPFNDGNNKTISCKNFNHGNKFHFPDGRFIAVSWDIDWKTASDPSNPCQCNMKSYDGLIPAYDPRIMPQYAKENQLNKKWCDSIYQAGYKNWSCSKYNPGYIVI